jgi:hypothetical protein
MSWLLSRRNVIAALAGLPSSANASCNNSNPDTPLLRLGDEFKRLAATLDDLLGLPAGADQDHRGLLCVLKEMEPVEAAIASCRAETIAGMRAKAEVANWSRQGDLNVDNDACLDARMARSIMRDLLNYQGGNCEST